MCGLAGFAGLKADQETRVKLVRSLASGIEKRGGHASGYVTYSAEPKAINYARTLGKWSDAAKGFVSTCARGETTIMHARYATHDNKEKVNCAHPFAVKRGDDSKTQLWGVHNGVVSGAQASATKYGRTFDVDSREVFELLADGKLADIAELSGYGTLAWLNRADPGVIYLVKMSEGADLEIAWIKGGGAIFASTWHIIQDAVKDAGLEYVDKPRAATKHGEVYAIDPRTEHQVIVADHAAVKLKSYSGKGWQDFSDSADYGEYGGVGFGRGSGHRSETNYGKYDNRGFSKSEFDKSWLQDYMRRNGGGNGNSESGGTGTESKRWYCGIHASQGYGGGCIMCARNKRGASQYASNGILHSWKCDKHNTQGYSVKECWTCEWELKEASRKAAEAKSDADRAGWYAAAEANGADPFHVDADGASMRPGTETSQLDAYRANKAKTPATPAVVDAINTSGGKRKSKRNARQQAKLDAAKAKLVGTPETETVDGWRLAENGDGWIKYLTANCDCYIWRKTLPSLLDTSTMPPITMPPKAIPLPPVPVSETINLDGTVEVPATEPLIEVEISDAFPCKSCAGDNIELQDMQWMCRDCGFAWDDDEPGADSTPEMAGITEASKDWTDEEWSAWLQTHFADDEPWAKCDNCDSSNVCQAVMSRLITCMNCFHTWDDPHAKAAAEESTETLVFPADKVGM